MHEPPAQAGFSAFCHDELLGDGMHYLIGAALVSVTIFVK